MFIYFSLFLIITISYLNEFFMAIIFNKKSLFHRTTLFKMIAILVVFLFLAFRYNNGWDYMQYFYTITNYTETNIVTRGEYLNNLLIILSRYLNSPIYYFLINAAIQIFGLSFVCLKYSQNFWLSFLLYISYPLFYLNSFSVVRMMTAVVIIFIGYHFLRQKKIGKFLLIIVIASGFHMSALMALCFIPVTLLVFNRKIIFFLGISSFFLINLISFVVTNFFPVYQVYLNRSESIEGTKAIFILLAIAILAFFNIERFQNNLSFKLFIVGLIIYISFFGYGTISHRLSLYGTIFSILVVPDLVEKILFKYRLMLLILYIPICFFMFYYSLQLGSQTFIPYNFFFRFN